jgi:hypothetical protein
MKTRLDLLIESINPSRTLDVLSARADEAINSFRHKSGVITDWRVFQACLSQYFCHLENLLLHLNPPRKVDFNMDWGRSILALRAEYGAEGEQAAFEIARTGAEGGIYAVLKAIARYQANWYAENEISARVAGYMNGLSAQERLDATREYIRKFGHLLPPEMTEGSAARIALHFYKTLCEHPRLLRRLRRVGR